MIRDTNISALRNRCDFHIRRNGRNLFIRQYRRKDMTVSHFINAGVRLKRESGTVAIIRKSIC